MPTHPIIFSILTVATVAFIIAQVRRFEPKLDCAYNKIICYLTEQKTTTVKYK